MANSTKKKTAAGKEVSIKKGKDIQQEPRALSPFEDIDRMMDRFFTRRFPRSLMHPLQWEWPDWSDLPLPFEGKRPNVDVINRDNEVIVRAELPGVDKKDVDVSLTDSTVTIKATHASESEEKEGDYYRSEISRGSFTRTIALPADVDGNKAKAGFKDGMLELTLPKLKQSKRRKVTVN